MRRCLQWRSVLIIGRENQVRDQMQLTASDSTRDLFAASTHFWRHESDVAILSWLKEKSFKESSVTVYQSMLTKLFRWLADRRIDLFSMEVVFPGRGGKPADEASLFRWVRNGLKEAGIEMGRRACPQTLRNTYGALLARDRECNEAIMAFMGLRSVDAVLDIRSGARMAGYVPGNRT